MHGRMEHAHKHDAILFAPLHRSMKYEHILDLIPSLYQIRALMIAHGYAQMVCEKAGLSDIACWWKDVEIQEPQAF